MPTRARTKIRVLIVDDHPLVVAGCITLFSNEPSIEVVSASDERSGYQAFLDQAPQVVIIDINLPDLSGFDLVRKIRKSDPEAKIVVFSMNDNPTFVVRAIELGALGFVSKSDRPEHLLQAVQAVAAGKKFIAPDLAQVIAFAGSALRSDPTTLLSPRELEILRMLARGRKLIEIADMTSVSYKTIANSTSLMKQKLGARSHSDLIRLAVEMGL